MRRFPKGRRGLAEAADRQNYNRPGLEKQDRGLECEVIDPFGNRVRFLER